MLAGLDFFCLFKDFQYFAMILYLSCLQMIESALLNKQEGAGKYLGWGSINSIDFQLFG